MVKWLKMAVKKKAIDTWKVKQWFALIAPKLFNEVEVAQVPAQDAVHLLNRIVEMPLKDITKDLAHLYINVKLRVEEIKGKNAYTKFIGHAIAREYLQALGRKGRSMLYIIFSVTSSDGVVFKVKLLVVTNGKASAGQRTALRKKAVEFLSQKISNQEFGKFIQEVLYGKASSELHNVLKKIYPIKRVEIYKSELKEVFDIQEVAQDEQSTEPVQSEETELPPESDVQPSPA